MSTNIAILSEHQSQLDYVETKTREINGSVVGLYHNLQLTSHYQPIFSLAHRRPVGYEALLRATNASQESIPPLEIFQMAKDDSDIVLLDRLCRNIHLRNFLSQSDNKSWLFLNVNPKVVVRGKHHGPFFANLLEQYGIPAHRIVVEIVEEQIHDESLLAEAINYYKEMGCVVAIDDFGAGHSNFDRIWRIAPHIVKLDRSIISQAVSNPKVRRVLPSLVSVLHESGSLSLMEGIETEDEALLAMDAGIDFAQGYYFGKPRQDLINPNKTHGELRDLCEKFRVYTKKEVKKYHEELYRYVRDFRESANRLEAGMELEPACSEFLLHPKTERCYLLNSSGKQLDANVVSPFRSILHDPRFEPLSDANDAVWSRRHYFRRALDQPGEVQISRPYLSITGANMCVTLSISLGSGNDTRVFCCDLDWTES